MLSIIVAKTENNVIGKNNDLLFKLKEDMKWFKWNTINKKIIMGRKTYESINSKPLKNRENIVLSRTPNIYQNVKVINNLDEILSNIPNNEEVFIIGGGSIYKEALNLADRLYITTIFQKVEGDTYFPEFNIKNWTENQDIVKKYYKENNLNNEILEQDHIKFQFKVLDRIKNNRD